MSPTFDFLRLSGELRNKIYKYTLVFEKPLKWACGSPYFSAEPDLALLQVNKQIHSEAQAVFYEDCTFSIPMCKKRMAHNKQTLRSFQDSIPLRTWPRIENLRLDLSCNYMDANDEFPYDFYDDPHHCRISKMMEKAINTLSLAQHRSKSLSSLIIYSDDETIFQWENEYAPFLSPVTYLDAGLRELDDGLTKLLLPSQKFTFEIQPSYKMSPEQCQEWADDNLSKFGWAVKILEPKVKSFDVRNPVSLENGPSDGTN